MNNILFIIEIIEKKTVTFVLIYNHYLMATADLRLNALRQYQETPAKISHHQPSHRRSHQANKNVTFNDTNELEKRDVSKLIEFQNNTMRNYSKVVTDGASERRDMSVLHAINERSNNEYENRRAMRQYSKPTPTKLYPVIVEKVQPTQVDINNESTFPTLAVTENTQSTSSGWNKLFWNRDISNKTCATSNNVIILETNVKEDEQNEKKLFEGAISMVDDLAMIYDDLLDNERLNIQKQQNTSKQIANGFKLVVAKHVPEKKTFY